jgi:hypothetical protein
VALGTTAPEGSTTVPVTAVELPDWATALRPSPKQKTARKAARSDLLYEANMKSSKENRSQKSN